MTCRYPHCDAGVMGSHCMAECMKVKLTNDRSTAVDQDYFWRPLHTCPLSAKVQLLTTGGVAVYGQYSPGTAGYLGWAPLPKRPDWMK